MANVIKLISPTPPKTSEGKDELNLAEFPIALLTDRASPGQDTLEFQDTIHDNGIGKPITRKLTITAATKYGLPTAKDEEVILGLIQLTKLANNFTRRTVHFSRYELIHLLRWRDESHSYHRIEESLNRWIGVTFYYDKAWWDKGAGTWVDEKFHILENVSLYDQDRPRRSGTDQNSLAFSSFTWNKVLFRSFQAGYLKRLDLDFYLSLNSSPAKRLYRFLDKRFYHGPRQEFDLFRLAFEHIGLSRSYTKAIHVRRKLTPAIEELEAKDFLEKLDASKRYIQVRRGEWKVIFIKKSKERADLPPPATATVLERQLTDRGVTASTAAELVAAFPAEQIAGKLEVFDWMVETKKKHISENPAGYLVASIRGDYAAPKGFLPKAERERKKQAAEQAQKKKADDLAAKRRQEERDRTVRLAERAHIDAYLKALTPQERKGLEEQAVANANDKMREAAKPGSIMAEMALRLLVDSEVLRIHPLGPLPDSQPTS
jgi:Replication initiator protein A